jgi:twitching motility protein PilT
MMTFDDCIIELFEKGLITEETSIAYASNRANVNRGVDLIKKGRGERTSTIGTLEVDKSYGRPQHKDPWRK